MILINLSLSDRFETTVAIPLVVASLPRGPDTASRRSRVLNFVLVFFVFWSGSGAQWAPPRHFCNLSPSPSRGRSSSLFLVGLFLIFGDIDQLILRSSDVSLFMGASRSCIFQLLRSSGSCSRSFLGHSLLTFF